MRLFDPERPRLSGTNRPTLLDHVFVVPGLHLDPEEEGMVEVSVWVTTGYNCFSSRYIVIPISFVSEFLIQYYDDPEAVLKEVFQWMPVKQQQKQQSTLSLEDLDL